MSFSHPLAKSARVFIAKNNDGSEYRVLAVATTLELDPKSHSYKKPFVERLSKAATDYLARSNEAACGRPYE
jgi:predicted HAD superfamily phosphohydrolase YqeG